MSIILILNPAPVVAFIRINLVEKLHLKLKLFSFSQTHLVLARDVAPEHYALLLCVIVDAMRTEAGDAHTLLLLHPVLDPVQLHYRSAL